MDTATVLDRLLPLLPADLNAAKRVQITSLSKGIATVVIEATGLSSSEAKRLEEACKQGCTRLSLGTRCVVSMEPDVQKKQTPTPPAPAQHILAVAAGKGGVGKSTIAFNLAKTFALQNKTVGLLDVDLQGPSLPALLGSFDSIKTKDNKFIPCLVENIQCMSLGFIIPKDKAGIWRGPVMQKLTYQLLFQTYWQKLDLLILDFPPGTGDVPLSIAKALAKTMTAVLITTPGQLALDDVQRTASMFRTLSIPVLGLIANMTAFKCPHCGKATSILPSTNMETFSTQMKVKLLGSFPFDPSLALSSQPVPPYRVTHETICISLWKALEDTRKTR